jgi:DNA modification methylase
VAIAETTIHLDSSNKTLAPQTAPLDRDSQSQRPADPHRIACGDATDAAAVAALLGDLKPELMVTDPPYGVNYDPAWRHRAGVNRSKRINKVHNDDQPDWGAAWASYTGNIAYVWHGALHATTVSESLVRRGFAIRSQIVWAKQRLVMSRGDYHWQHEPCWYAVRQGPANWKGDRRQSTLWQIAAREGRGLEHGTQKPVECMKRPIENNSRPGDVVYDPFVGSFTTGIACEMTGRVVLGMEIDPAYVDCGVLRWMAFTGKTAILERDGRSFPAVAAERPTGLRGD